MPRKKIWGRLQYARGTATASTLGLPMKIAISAGAASVSSTVMIASAPSARVTSLLT